ncbi:MAG: FMN-binding protein [Clostridia bacterium]|nr:FMN-binding protein [Clostridia bacterium]MBR2955898.1 FMN-binding protein [Clostridia bacterium]
MTKSEAKVKRAPFFTKDLVKCVVVLAVIALVASALLGVMNWLTYVDPNETIMKEVATYYGVSLEDVSVEENMSKGTNVNNCFVAKDGDKTLGYCFYAVGTGAKDGTMELLVYINNEGVITEIECYAQGETAGYYDKVEKANKSKYVGIDCDDVETIKLIGSKDTPAGKGEINALSGATYTSKGYHNAVAAAVNSYNQNKGVAHENE